MLKMYAVTSFVTLRTMYAQVPDCTIISTTTTLWSSCGIKDHPYGRQKYMLELGLVDTFNGMKNHPSDDAILKANNMNVAEYQKLCRSLTS